MASKKQHLESLKSIALFSTCSKRELEKVAKASDETQLPTGAIVMEQGTNGREAFVILEGEVTVKRNNRKVATLGPGEIVGELSLLDHGPRTASVVAATDVTALVIDGQRFLGVIEEVPAISQKLFAALAGRLREVDRKTYG